MGLCKRLEHTGLPRPGMPAVIGVSGGLDSTLALLVACKTFDEMKLPTQRRTGITGEASTNQETLERLAALGHELPRRIVEHRQIAKLKGTYVDALPELVKIARSTPA